MFFAIGPPILFIGSINRGSRNSPLFKKMASEKTENIVFKFLTGLRMSAQLVSEPVNGGLVPSVLTMTNCEAAALPKLAAHPAYAGPNAYIDITTEEELIAITTSVPINTKGAHVHLNVFDNTDLALLENKQWETLAGTGIAARHFYFFDEMSLLGGLFGGGGFIYYTDEWATKSDCTTPLFAVKQALFLNCLIKNGQTCDGDTAGIYQSPYSKPDRLRQKLRNNLKSCMTPFAENKLLVFGELHIGSETLYDRAVTAKEGATESSDYLIRHIQHNAKRKFTG